VLEQRTRIHRVGIGSDRGSEKISRDARGDTDIARNLLSEVLLRDPPKGFTEVLEQRTRTHRVGIGSDRGSEKEHLI